MALQPNLCPSSRARRITLSVRPSGEVRLTYPCGVSAERALQFFEAKRAWVERALQRLAAREAVSPRKLCTPEEVEAMRCEAKRDLPPRIERIAKATGLNYRKVTIRAARTKWGSCSTDGSISLSLFLVALPEHLRDFVILHELCHTVHHNHSERFHRLLDHLSGGCERQLQAELRRYRIG